MSDHNWVQENMASYVAGGLDAAECDRLDEHVATCTACARALANAQAMDANLNQLFADVRPEPALEDRMIQALRRKPLAGRRQLSLLVWIGLGAAAVVLLGAFGATASYVLQREGLPFPGLVSLSAPESQPLVSYGFPGSKSANNLKPLGSAVSPLKDAEEMAQESRRSTLVSVAGEQAPFRDSNAAVNSDRLDDKRASGWGLERQTEAGKLDNLGVSDDGRSLQRDMPTRLQNETLSEKESVYTYRHARLAAPAVPPVVGVLESKKLGDEAEKSKSPYLNILQVVPPGDQAGLKPGNWPEQDKAGATAMTAAPMSFGDQGKGKDKDGKPEVKTETHGQGKETGGGAAPGATVANGSVRTVPDQPVQNPVPGGDKKPDEPGAPTGTPRKIVIRSGDIEFEIDSFDSAVAAITKLVSDIKGGFVATVNSEKLPNGKVRGSVVVRVPPERLDGLVLDLRRELGKGGELKGLRIGSQDITKQYTDLESRLRAARAMEERLLLIIKTGKGEIKDLLQAEKELGVWRTKIEEFEGELRYYTNLVSLSTLTITLAEKEILAPYSITETERIQMGIEVEEVDKAMREALAAVTEAKGRVTKSELKQLAAGQFSALVHFEVAPDAAGPLRDRLKQLGTVARLDIERVQQAQGGSGKPQDAKSKRNDSQFFVSLYNLMTIAPRETMVITLACVDTEAAYKTILARVQKATGRVLTSNLNRERSEQTTGSIHFDVKVVEADAVLADIKEAGEVLSMQVTENPDVQNVTRSKRGFQVQLWALSQVQPRETTTIKLATRDVPAAYRELKDAVAKAKGRIIDAQLNEQDKKKVTAQLDFDVRRVEDAGVTAALNKLGDIHSRSTTRIQDSDKVIDSKLRYKINVINVAAVQPRENVKLGIEVSNVDKTAAAFMTQVGEMAGRVVESNLTHERSGRVIARLTFDVPLAAAPALVDKLVAAGTVRVQEASKNPQVPETDLAIARLDVTLSNADLIVPSDEGLWPSIRTGLSYSFKVGAWSLSWVILGVCVVLPWALVLYAVYRVVLRMRKKAGAASPA
jgi:glycine cleavage system regulatory protein